MKKTTTPKASTNTGLGKILKGKVISTKMKDTIVVQIERYVKHPQYGKFIRLRKNIKAHDAGNTKVEGETVSIKETKPISKDKRFTVVN